MTKDEWAVGCKLNPQTDGIALIFWLFYFTAFCMSLSSTARTIIEGKTNSQTMSEVKLNTLHGSLKQVRNQCGALSAVVMCSVDFYVDFILFCSHSWDCICLLTKTGFSSSFCMLSWTPECMFNHAVFKMVYFCVVSFDRIYCLLLEVSAFITKALCYFAVCHVKSFFLKFYFLFLVILSLFLLHYLSAPSFLKLLLLCISCVKFF